MHLIARFKQASRLSRKLGLIYHLNHHISFSMKKHLLLLTTILLCNFALGNEDVRQNPKVLFDRGASLSFTGEEEGVLLITHPMFLYDFRAVAMEGVTRALLYSRDHNFKTIALLDFESHKQDGLRKLYFRDDDSLQFPLHYLTPSLPVDFYIHSVWGEHSLSLNNTRVLLAGGQIQVCFLQSLIQYVGLAFQKMAVAQKRPIVFTYLITDAIYGFPPVKRSDHVQTLDQMGSDHFSIDYWDSIDYPYIIDIDAHVEYLIYATNLHTLLKTENEQLKGLLEEIKPGSPSLSYLEPAIIVSDGDEIEFGHGFTTGKENILVITYLTSHQLIAGFDFASHEQNILREIENMSRRLRQFKFLMFLLSIQEPLYLFEDNSYMPK